MREVAGGLETAHVTAPYRPDEPAQLEFDLNNPMILKENYPIAGS